MFERFYQPRDVQLMLADLPPKERQRVWRSALVSCTQVYAMPILFGTLVWLGGMIYLEDFRRFRIAHDVLLVAGSILGLLAYIWLSWWRTRAQVRRELASIGRCAGCGYDIRETIGVDDRATDDLVACLVATPYGRATSSILPLPHLRL
jgi:hypothetical protein